MKKDSLPIAFVFVVWSVFIALAALKVYKIYTHSLGPIMPKFKKVEDLIHENN